jgi:putative transposase
LANSQLRSTGSKKNLVLNESVKARQLMVERDHPSINIKRQSDLLGVNRTSVYRPLSEKQTSAENIQIMHRIDEIYMKHPYYGYRRMTTTLREQSFDVNRKRVRRLMRLMGLEAIYPKPNLSKRLHAKYRRPYLLRGLTIDRPNQVWGIDITYLRMGKGFMYLFNIIDWYSRKVIDYELSNTLEKGFVLKCLRRAFRCCKPEIMNSDQGSHFTNADYLELLEKEGVKVSMDGKGRATDDSRTERYFRSLKYECIFLNEFDNPRVLRKGVDRYVQFYNQERPHQSINYAKPEQFYTQSIIVKAS